MNRKRTQGFTLIELLIVIAIIAVLAAIMIPSFSAARKRPYDVAALQCGKAIVAAQITYIAEHNELAASNYPGMNNADANEQCQNVQVSSNFGPIGTGGNANINVGGSNYSFFVWSNSGTGVYLYNRDSPTDHFRKVN